MTEKEAIFPNEEQTIISNNETTCAEQTVPDKSENVMIQEDNCVSGEVTSEPLPEPLETFEAVSTPSIEELSKQLAEAERKVQEHWESLLRQRAESENLRKRVERDLENIRKYALEKFAKELITVKDSMELGLEAVSKPDIDIETVRDGIALTLKLLTDTLEKSEIVTLDPLNEKFNPQWHEAMVMQPAPGVEEGTVIFVHQKGYQLYDRLLRPARVIVAKAVESPVAEEKPLEN